MKNYKLRKKLFLMMLASSLSSLTTACRDELAPIEEYDTISNDESGLENGLKQVIDVPGEDFKLVAE